MTDPLLTALLLSSLMNAAFLLTFHCRESLQVCYITAQGVSAQVEIIQINTVIPYAFHLLLFYSMCVSNLVQLKYQVTSKIFPLTQFLPIRCALLKRGSERERVRWREKRQKERIPRSAVCFSYCCQLNASSSYKA